MFPPAVGLLQIGQWHLGANDNDVLGWTTTAAYAAATLACAFAARAARAPGAPPDAPRRLFWTAASLFLLLLGLNKQLDLQLLAIELARRLAPLEIRRDRTFYRHLAAGLLLLGILAATTAAFTLRRAWSGLKRPAFLLGTLLGFIFIRSGTVRRLSENINTLHQDALHLLLELIPLLGLTVLACRAQTRQQPPSPAPPPAPHTT